MKKNLITAIMAIATICSVTRVRASTFPIVESSVFETFAINRRGVLAETGMRTYMGRYMITVGHNVEAVPGDYVDVELSNNRIIPCVVLDKRGLVDATGAEDITFVVDKDNASADIKRYRTVSVNDKFSGDVVNIKVLQPQDYVSVAFDRVAYNADVQNKRLVIDKRVVEIAGKKFFFVYYSSNSNCNVKQVTEEDYNSILVDWSVVDVQGM